MAHDAVGICGRRMCRQGVRPVLAGAAIGVAVVKEDEAARARVLHEEQPDDGQWSAKLVRAGAFSSRARFTFSTKR